ncbi:hypothetical protein CEXT_639211 [Caerostris extrusa]|uniref:Uncharacterized protein n=1 Tax=Caerostris extrusa TaxID=172846 RepID=A0AAV4VFQ9_CAEEX|nr:hypothetical protein CEXT_639211 [Caerostris extrusa]
MKCQRTKTTTRDTKQKETGDFFLSLNSSKSQFHYMPTHPTPNRGRQEKRAFGTKKKKKVKKKTNREEEKSATKVHGRQSSELSICLSPGRLMAMRLLNGRNIRTKGVVP